MIEQTEIEKKLLHTRELYWIKLDDKTKKYIFKFCEGYKKFLNSAKTERLAYQEILKFAESNGFKNIDEIKDLKEGTKIYVIKKNKCIALIVIGKQSIKKGFNLVISHIDSPRLDLKPRPLYEDNDTNLALLKTHYYGGIKKYQWVSTPLSLYGTIIKKDGSEVEIKIGENESEPVFVIPDLLPHLSEEQYKRTLQEGIKGEELNVLVGGIPINNAKVKEKVKIGILSYLNEKYGLVEEDFASAELEIVPCEKTRDVGIDSSFVGGYGQDDRICAYTSLCAISDIKVPEKTAIAMFIDKEEIGSEGITSIQSEFLRSIASELLNLIERKYDGLSMIEIFANSKAISADVNSALHPSFKDAYEINNSSKLGFGVVITKYTGRGGKFGASDASAEYVGKIRKLFNENNIAWQTGELGRVDLGGGGTVAKYIAHHDIEVIDCGPPILGMHSQFEISSKCDIYSAYLAYKSFLNVDLEKY